MRTVARTGMLVATLVVAAGVPVLGAAPAQATSYRYWTYWHGDSGSWSFSGVGASSWRVKDGSVEGWRFAVSAGTRSAPRPRYDAASAFQTLCGDVAKPDGDGARVALVVDFGTADDARPGDDPREPALRGVCTVVSPSGGSAPTGMTVLGESGTSVREDSGMVCGLAGYPSAGCGEVVRTPSASPSPSPSRPASSSPKPTRTSTPSSPSSPATGSSTPRTSSASTPGTSASTAAVGSASPAATSPTPGASTSASASASSSGAGVGDGADPSASPSLVVGLADSGEPASGSTPWPLLAGVALVAALGGSAWWTSRRRGAA